MECYDSQLYAGTSGALECSITTRGEEESLREIVSDGGKLDGGNDPRWKRMKHRLDPRLGQDSIPIGKW